MRTPGSALELERVRLIAVRMFERGVPCKQIAQDVGVHVQTVRQWRRIWHKTGAEGLLHKPHPGRPALLGADQKQELLQLLQHEPTAHGFSRHFWTTAMIAELIKQKFGIDYHHDWVGEMLHALGMSWQKPMRRARERDEVKIASWRSELWPQLQKKVPTQTA
jgi:transposase